MSNNEFRAEPPTIKISSFVLAPQCQSYPGGERKGVKIEFEADPGWHQIPLIWRFMSRRSDGKDYWHEMLRIDSDVPTMQKGCVYLNFVFDEMADYQVLVDYDDYASEVESEIISINPNGGLD